MICVREFSRGLCPYCGTPRGIRQRDQQLMHTCGKAKCRARFLAALMPKDHFKKIGRVGGKVCKADRKSA